MKDRKYRSLVKFILTGMVFVSVLGFAQRDIFTLNGEWQLSLIRINSDTMFYRDHSEYTYRYNWNLKRDFPETKEDSNAVLDRVKQGYDKAMGVKILFDKDSLFQMTRIRSGGKWFLNEYDSGVYAVAHDTILMTNQTRKDKKMMLVIDKSGEKIFVKDGFPDHMIYIEYRKKKF